MAFTVTPKDAPAKVEGVLNGTQKSPRDRAIQALMGNAPAQEAPKPAPNVDPAATAATNGHPGDGQLSPEAFSAIQQKARAAQETSTQNQNPSSEAASATPPKTASEATDTNEGTEQPLNPRFAQLARQEKVLRDRVNQLKAKEADFDNRVAAAIKAKEAELQGKYVPKDRLTRETLAVLNENGVDYDSLTQQALGEPADPRDVAISELRAELAAIKEAQAQDREALQNDKTQSYAQAKNEIKNNVTRLVSKDPSYEMIQATDSINDVVELIESTFHEGLDDDHPKGTLLTVEEASQIVEDYLMAEGERISRLQKIQKRLAPQEPKKDPVPPKQESSVQPQRQPTLTNGMTGAPRKEYTQRQRAVFAATYGPNWQEKVGDKAS